MAFLQPLPQDTTPELSEDFDLFTRILGFVPNSLLTMQRKPEIVKAFSVLTRAVMDPQGSVDPGFKRLLAHMASHAAGCRYCEAHSLIAAQLHDIPEQKVAELWDFRTSPLFDDAERAALEFALAAGAVPNAVDQEIFDALARHWSEEQIVEILAAISLYGFLNRWNDSMATELEAEPLKLGERHLASHGWRRGKHG